MSEPRVFYDRPNIPELVQEAMEHLRELLKPLQLHERQETLAGLQAELMREAKCGETARND